MVKQTTVRGAGFVRSHALGAHPRESQSSSLLLHRYRPSRLPVPLGPPVQEYMRLWPMNGIMNPPTALLHPQRSPLRLAHESTLWNLLGDLRGQHHVTILVHVVVVALTVLNPVRSHVCRCGGRRNARERERFEETRSLRLCETVIHGARRHRPGTRSRQEMSRRCPGPDSQTGKGLAGVGEANWLTSRDVQVLLFVRPLSTAP